MLGLPGDTLEKSINTAKRLIELKPDMARIYPTLVIRDTALEQEYIGGKYIPLSLDEAVRWCSILVPMYENAGIKVIRVGLHAEELIRENEIVAGPVHPAFGALVYSKIWLDRITETIEKTSMHNKRKLIIHVAPSDVSLVTGQNRRNVDFLKENYRFSVVKVIGDQNSRNSFEMEFGISYLFTVILLVKGFQRTIILFRCIFRLTNKLLPLPARWRIRHVRVCGIFRDGA